MFRFTIRDVLWLTALVALAVGWWLDRNSLRRELGSFATQIEAAKLQQLKTEQELSKVNLQLRAAQAKQQHVRANDARLSQTYWDDTKARSAELGAPQPKPLPDGY
jgi:hypothetical protein